MNLSQTSTPEFLYGGRYKVLGDPVHRMMAMDDAVIQIVDTPEFQRLRDLKQLGSAYYVFPGASHNRFEHSLGVSWLSGQQIDFLSARQPELGILDEEKMWVRIAGAVHDLGHGPFSHVFDGLFIPTARPGLSWTHERMSMDLFDCLLDDNDISLLDLADPTGEGRYDEKFGREAVKRMVFGAKAAGGGGHGDHGGGGGGLAAGFTQPGALLQEEKPFLFQIVANGLTGIDTDKFDYIARDTHNVGLQSSFDHNRLMYSARVVDGSIAYHAKECLAVYELFHTRYMLFKQIYVHRATKAVEYMITDILLEANAAWNGRLANAIDDPRQYALLTDCVLKDIEVGDDGGLERAKSLVKDLRRRKLYRFIDEVLVPLSVMDKMPKVTAEDVCSLNPEPSTQLRPEDIIVHDARFNYGKGDANPVDSCLFYRDPTDTRAFHVRSDRVSHLLPTVFQERVIRVYTRSLDERKWKCIQVAFRRYLSLFTTVSMRPDPSSKVYASQLFSPPVGEDGESPMVPTRTMAMTALPCRGGSGDDDMLMGARSQAAHHVTCSGPPSAATTTASLPVKRAGQGSAARTGSVGGGGDVLPSSQTMRPPHPRLVPTAPPVAVHGSSGVYASPARHRGSAAGSAWTSAERAVVSVVGSAPPSPSASSSATTDGAAAGVSGSLPMARVLDLGGSGGGEGGGGISTLMGHGQGVANVWHGTSHRSSADVSASMGVDIVLLPGVHDGDGEGGHDRTSGPVVGAKRTALRPPTNGTNNNGTSTSASTTAPLPASTGGGGTGIAAFFKPALEGCMERGGGGAAKRARMG